MYVYVGGWVGECMYAWVCASVDLSNFPTVMVFLFISASSTLEVSCHS